MAQGDSDAAGFFAGMDAETATKKKGLFSQVIDKAKKSGVGKAVGKAKAAAGKASAGYQNVSAAGGMANRHSALLQKQRTEGLSEEEEKELAGIGEKKSALSGLAKFSFVGTKFHSLFSSWLGPIIVFVVTIVFGGFLQFFFPLFLVIGLVAGFVLVGLKAFPTLTKYILAIGIIIILLFIPMSPIAKSYGIDYGSLSLTGKQSSKATAGVQTQLSATFSCILGGTNCELITNTYKSEQAQSDYTAQVSDVGVKLEHLGPARDFASKDTPEIQAIVNAKGFYKSPIGVIVSAASASTDQKIKDVLTGGSWNCPTISPSNNIRNKFISCSYNQEICVKEGDTFNMPVEVSIIAQNTVTMASKQFALTTSGVMSSIEGDDQLSYFGFDKENFKSVQIGDESANLAIYATTRQDVLPGDFANTIAIKIANPGSGKLMPSRINLTMPAQLAKYIDSDKSQFNPTDAQKAQQNGTITLVRSISGDIETSKFKNWYLVFNDKLSKEVKNSEVTVFSIAASATYNYADSQSLIVPITGSGTC